MDDAYNTDFEDTLGFTNDIVEFVDQDTSVLLDVMGELEILFANYYFIGLASF